jgi:membrane protein required for colicin V production
MHWLDTTLLAALCLGAVLGFVSGLFWQLARIASFVLAVYATIFLHEPAVQLLRQSLPRDTEAGIVSAAAYLTVFLLAYLFLFLLTRLLRSWLRSTDLAPLDRLLGAGLGLGKVALVLAVVCWTLPRWPHPRPKEWHDGSTLASLFARGIDAALVQIPDTYKQPILETFEQWRTSAGSSAGKA